MEIINNLLQGTQEWHAFRSQHNMASLTPVVMGLSPYQQRNHLIKTLATGIEKEVNEMLQRIFDRGHEFESYARTRIENELGIELYPVIVKDGEYAASLDGIDMLATLLFEHKTMNESLRFVTDAAQLPKHYYMQVQHQLMVSGAQRAIFCASKWENKQCVEWMTLEILPHEQAFIEIKNAWVQFKQDVEQAKASPQQFVIEDKQTVIDRYTVPALSVELTGEIKNTSLALFKKEAQLVIRSINMTPSSDEDFAQAESDVKYCKEVESKIALVRDAALNQTESIANFFNALDDLAKEVRDARLALEKTVTKRKEQIKLECLNQARAQYDQFIQDRKQKHPWFVVPTSAPDFAFAIKGLKSITSIKNKLDDALAQGKINAVAHFDECEKKIKLIESMNLPFKLHDLNQLMYKELDDLQAVLAMRLNEYEQAQKKREQAAIEAALQAEQQRREAEQRRIEQEEMKRLQQAQQQEQRQPQQLVQVQPPPVVLEREPKYEHIQVSRIIKFAEKFNEAMFVELMFRVIDFHEVLKSMFEQALKFDKDISFEEFCHVAITADRSVLAQAFIANFDHELGKE